MSEQGEMSKARGVPWKAHGRDVFDDTDELVCATVIATDAAFIASRINAHDALVEALQAARAFAEAEMETRGNEDVVYDMPAAPLVEAIDAALNLAEEPTLDPAGLVSP